ncbi:hypothetical protein DXG03_006303, partial [Asterophora parasitica]
FIKTIRDERKYEKVGAIGYCYGGAAAVRLGATGLVESLIICHPGPITIAQVKAIKARKLIYTTRHELWSDLLDAGSYRL